MGTERAEQFDGFKNIGFADAIGPYDQHAGMGQIQLQMRLVAEPLQRQLLKPDGSRSGVWLRYLQRDGVSADLQLRLRSVSGHVAQLDRASDSGSEGRGFESLHARDSFRLS